MDYDNDVANLSNRDFNYKHKTLQTANDEFHSNRIISNINKINYDVNKTNLDNNFEENLEASDFRRTLRAQLSKNHNKIFSNLKRLYINNDNIKNPEIGTNGNSNKRNSKSPCNTNKDYSSNINNIELNKNKSKKQFPNQNFRGKSLIQDEEENIEIENENLIDFQSNKNRTNNDYFNDASNHVSQSKSAKRTLSNPEEFISSDKDAGNFKKISKSNQIINTNLTESKYLGI